MDFDFFTFLTFTNQLTIGSGLFLFNAEFMEKNLQTLERQVYLQYQSILQPLAESYHYDLPPFPKATDGKPSVILLGNHSSGKSTFINYLLGDSLQKTGVAPTDDGFTLVVSGSKNEENRGPGAIERRDFPFVGMEKLGPGFLSRLRVKSNTSDILHHVNLIDSPGMIDTADTSAERGYDFMASVRFFADNADLILFFFDPEKPGTTGETLAAFTQSLSGMEHKILIVLNKVDTFSNIRDFARDYGSLCWNLARVVRTKDLPHIFTMYVPTNSANRPAEAIALEDFDIARDEVIHEIQNAHIRRADNLVGNLKEQSLRLELYIQICSYLRQTNLRHRFLVGLLSILFATGTAAYAYFVTPDPLVIGIGAGLTVVTWTLGAFLLKKRRIARRDELDDIFNKIYLTELTVSQRDDLTSRWNFIKPRIQNLLEKLGEYSLPRRCLRFNRKFKKLKSLRKFKKD